MLRAHLKVTDYDTHVRPTVAELGRYCATMTSILTGELDGAALTAGTGRREFLLATLGRTIHRTLGEGIAAVDVVCDDAIHPVALACIGPDRLPAADVLAAAHESLAAASGRRPATPVPQTPDRPDVLLAVDESMPAPARLGHYLELHVRAHRTGLLLEWWYDIRSYEPYTIVELAEQFPYAMIELTATAAPLTVAGRQLAAAY